MVLPGIVQDFRLSGVGVTAYLSFPTAVRVVPMYV